MRASSLAPGIALALAITSAASAIPLEPHENAGILPGGLWLEPCLPPLFVDTLYSFPGGSTWPSGLAWDGTHFWVGDLDTNQIKRMDTTGSVVSVIEGYEPAGIVHDGRHLWVVVENSAMLYKLDPASGAALDSFRLPDSLSGDPQSWGLAWDGTHFWHSQYGGAYPGREKVFKLDATTLRAVDSFVPAARRMLAIEWRDSLLCGLEISLKRLYWIDPVTGVFVDSTAWPVPYPLGMAWCHGHLWNASGASRSTYRGLERVYRTDVLTGIEEPSATPAPRTGLHPTIVRGILRLADGRRETGDRAWLMDAAGRKVMDLEPGENDVRHLSQGIYFVVTPSPQPSGSASGFAKPPEGERIKERGELSAVSGERAAVRRVVVTR